MVRWCYLVAVLILFYVRSGAQQPYPYPVSFMRLDIEGKAVNMAYMDIAPSKANGRTAILFHGKNFNGYYWKDVIAYLHEKGYRVIVPDQVGWGRSDKPDIHYSFHALAVNNKILLDSLHIPVVTVIGHSMGGMLATRFVLMYPHSVSRLVLEDPIGLEDYRTFVPYTPLDSLYSGELNATYDSYKKYMQSYFPVWKPEYDELVRQQAAAFKDTAFRAVAWANALTYQMIYEQPVCYEFKYIRIPTLVIVGTADHTIVGKGRVPEQLVGQHGRYPQLGEYVHGQIQGSSLVEIQGVGHIPHIQDLEAFKKALEGFL